MAERTGAKVYCSALAARVLTGPDGCDATGYPIPCVDAGAVQIVDDGSAVTVGAFTASVVATPGHGPGDLTYEIAGHLFCGDLLFHRSVGRTDFPGGDFPTLLASVARLVARYPASTPVHPGHMQSTTLGDELKHNPFLGGLGQMTEQLNAPKGTYDILPADQPVRRWVIAKAEAVFQRYGYARIDTPTFEETRLFTRGVGESTDIVRKEMYTFDDLGGRSMTLRPEGTAPVARAYIEHGMHTLPQPVKLYYHSPMFRYESPSRVATGSTISLGWRRSDARLPSWTPR